MIELESGVACVVLRCLAGACLHRAWSKFLCVGASACESWPGFL